MSKELKKVVKEMTNIGTEYIREDILSDLWAANKKVVDGKWYIELSEAIKIIGGEK